MNHEAMRAQQIAEMTMRDKLLELAKQYEERGRDMVVMLGQSDPSYAYQYRELCNRISNEYKTFAWETFL